MRQLGLDKMLGFGRKRHTHDCYPLWISDYYDLENLNSRLQGECCKVCRSLYKDPEAELEKMLWRISYWRSEFRKPASQVKTDVQAIAREQHTRAREFRGRYFLILEGRSNVRWGSTARLSLSLCSTKTLTVSRGLELRVCRA
jgi:hypothetical protein